MVKSLITALLLFLISIAQAPGQPDTFDARIRSLISQMTLEEKISQLTTNNPAIPRLGIPHFDWQAECLHGLVDDSVTVFPQSIGLAAMWNPPLVYDIAQAISDEGRIRYRQKGTGLCYWSPNLEIARDPRWGRVQETYGEDPYLASRIGVAFIKGLQGNDPVYWKTVASPKHFFAHSGPEPKRYGFNAVVSEKDLWETYLPPWQAAFTEAKSHGVMTAYSAVNGIPNAANYYFLRDILRGKWGFDGYVATDCGAIVSIIWGHGYTTTETGTVAVALLAGNDMECGTMYTDHLQKALKEGLVTVADIDSAVYHLLWTRFRLGLFDHADSVAFNKIPVSRLNCRDHLDLAYKAARQSMVLLKNDNNTLPLSKDYDSILVIGPKAVGENYGSYSGYSNFHISALDGIKGKVYSKTRVNYAQGCDVVGFFTELMPSRYLRTPDGKTGLLGEYFNNKNLSGKPDMVRNDSLINFNWKESSPGGKIKNDSFSVRWTGYIRVDSTGIYTIKLLTDDGMKFYFDSIKVIDDWNDHGTVERITVVKMEAGRYYPIKIEYYDNAKYADARLEIGTATTGAGKIDSLVNYAAKHDAVVFVGGLGNDLESEHTLIRLPGFFDGDRTSLDLPMVQARLLMKLNKIKKPLVLVMVNGGCISIKDINDSIPAIIEMWYGSQEYGKALGDILFGDYNPSGKLPVTFYKTADDLPDFESYDMAGRTYRYFGKEPLFPFGYGLSYTKYNYKSMNLPVKEVEIGTSDTIPVYFNISNDGKKDGDEIVQLYCRSLDSKHNRPLKWLAGFKRISIKSGKTIKDTLMLSLNSLAVYDTSIHGFFLEPGRFELQLAASSADARIIDTVTLKMKPIIGVESHQDGQFQIWPNPANDILYIKTDLLLRDDFIFSVFDLLGNRKYCEAMVSNNQDICSLNVSGLQSGTYFLNIKSGTCQYNYRLVIGK